MSTCSVDYNMFACGYSPAHLPVSLSAPLHVYLPAPLAVAVAVVVAIVLIVVVIAVARVVAVPWNIRIWPVPGLWQERHR